MRKAAAALTTRQRNAAGAIILDDGREAIGGADGAINIAGRDIARTFRTAAIGDMFHLDARTHFQKRAGQMADGANARRAIGEARPRFHRCNEFRDIARRIVALGHQHIGQRHRLADRHKGGFIIKRQAAMDQRRDGKGKAFKEQRIAIRRRSGDNAGANRTAATAPIFHNDVLAEKFRHARNKQPHHRIGLPTGRVGHHHANRAHGEILRARQAGCGQKTGCKQKGTALHHDALSADGTLPGRGVIGKSLSRPLIFSNKAATCKARASCRGGATICSPTGLPN